MSTRKIKDAKDLSTNELIYFKGHAQATYMSDGRTVEEAVNSMSGGSGEGDSDVFILDLFGIAGYPDDFTNTGTIEFAVDSELMSMIDNAIQKNKLVIRVDYVDLYNLEIDAYTSTKYLMINSHFEYVGNFVHLYMVINPSELSGMFSISPVTTGSGSGGSIDTSDCVKTIVVGYDGFPLTPNADGVINLRDTYICNSISIDGQNTNKYKYYPALRGNIDLGYIRKQLVESTSSSMTLSPNIYYRNTSTSLSTLTITFASETSALYNSLILNEYFVEFTTRSTGTTVSLPSSIKWANGETPTFENGKTYQISIVNNLGVCTKFG